MKLSSRIQNMSDSPIRKLSPYAALAKKEGKKVYGLNIGQPDIEAPEEFYEKIKEFKGILSYADSQGYSELLDSFVKYYKGKDILFKKEEIIVTIGATEALSMAMLVTCDIGDEILIPEPMYASYILLAQQNSVNIIPINTKVENDFRLPEEDEIVSLITDKTRAILISNPTNPTGRVYTKEEVYLIAKIAKEHDLFIFADEVYREFIYDDVELISFAHIDDIQDRVLLIDSISKRYSACGARIGSIASKNKDLMKQILKLAQARLCAPLLEQIGATSFTNVPEEYIIESQKEYKKRRDLVYQALSNMEGVVCHKPQGAFYMVVKLPVENAEDFIIWLLREFSIDNETIFLAPAAGFYGTEGLGLDEVRISYCINQESLKKAMNILAEGLKEYNKIKK